MWRKIWCKIFHTPLRGEFQFTDLVNNKPVSIFRCTKCKTKWLAHHQGSWFRLYKEE